MCCCLYLIYSKQPMDIHAVRNSLKIKPIFYGTNLFYRMNIAASSHICCVMEVAPMQVEVLTATFML